MPQRMGHMRKNAADIKMAVDAIELSFERDYITAQLGRFGGNISKTAQFIGMERSALHRKIKLLGLSSRNDEDIE